MKQASSQKLHPNGFALIATISVMVLLVMIALALLSLSTIELRQANLGKHQAEAQANARLALMMAIGQVQQELGHDQTATMQATVLAAGATGDGAIQAPDKNKPANEYLEGLHSVRNPHWLGAHPTYDPETGDDRLFWIRRPSDEVSSSSGTELYLYDSRYSNKDMSAISGKFDRTAHVNWLVSNPSSVPLNPATLIPEPLLGTAEDFEYKIADGAFFGPLMYPSTHSSRFPEPLTSPNKAPALATIEARAPLVALKDTQGKYSGGYAYIVSDDSLKYKISPRNAIAQNAGNAPKKSNANSYSQLLVPQNVHLEKIRVNGEADDKLSKLEQNNQTNAAKTLSLASLPLQADDQTFAHQPAYKFNPFFQHSFTAHGYGLLTDPVSGGLRRNLTAYLETPSRGANQDQQITPITAQSELGAESDGIIDDSLSDTTPLLFSLREKDPQSKTIGPGFMTAETDPDKRLTWFAPVFGLLRDYVQLRNPAGSGTDLSLVNPVVNPRAATQALGVFKNTWGTAHSTGKLNQGLLHSSSEPSAMTSWDADPSTGEFTAVVYTPGSGADKSSAPSMGLHPVLLKAAVYMYPCYNSSTQEIGNIWLPRVILYNPYNVKLAGKKYLVSIKRNSSRYGSRYRFVHTGNGASKDHYFNVSNGTDILGTLAGNTRDLVFTIDNTDEGLMPGESLLFCPDTSKGLETKAGGKYAKLLKANEGNFDKMVLSSKVSPSLGTAFYSLKLNSPHPGWMTGPSSEARIKMYSSSTQQSQESKRMIKLFLPSTKANLAAPLDASSLGDYSLLQAIEASVSYEYRGFTCPHPGISSLAKDQIPNLAGGGLTDPKQFDLKHLHAGWVGMRMIKDAEVSGQSCPSGTNSYPVFQQHDIRAPYVGHTWGIAQGKSFPTRQARDGQVNYYGQESYLWVWGRDGTTATVSDPLHVLSIDAPLNAPGRNGLNVMSAFTRTGTTRSDQASAPLFEVPRKDIPILSIAELRHARTNAFIGAPTYTLGESYGTRLSPRSGSTASWEQLLNSHKYTHWTTKGKRSYWSWLNYCVPRDSAPDWVKEIFEPFHYQIYDQSFELNHALWDRFFLTGINDYTSSMADEGFPNPRMLKNPYLGIEPEDSDYTDYYKAGESFIIDGSFNVNSTNPLAWQALLSSFRKIDIPLTDSGNLNVGDRSSFSRILTPLLDRNEEPTGLSGSGPVWQQTRSLTDEQIETLSLLIVEQVKRRAPFVSVSDFVNRRLVGGAGGVGGEGSIDIYGPSTETELSKLGLKGPLQTAIDESELNHYAPNDPNDYARSANPGTENVYNPVTQKGNTTSNKYANALGYLTQGDILAKIGPLLTVRGDTFTIRTYGDSRDASGKIRASARCEAVIQRVTDYLDTTADPLAQARYSKLTSDVNRRFGRRFKVISFRWLSPTE